MSLILRGFTVTCTCITLALSQKPPPVDQCGIPLSVSFNSSNGPAWISHYDSYGDFGAYEDDFEQAVYSTFEYFTNRSMDYELSEPYTNRPWQYGGITGYTACTLFTEPISSLPTCSQGPGGSTPSDNYQYLNKIFFCVQADQSPFSFLAYLNTIIQDDEFMHIFRSFESQIEAPPIEAPTTSAMPTASPISYSPTVNPTADPTTSAMPTASPTSHVPTTSPTISVPTAEPNTSAMPTTSPTTSAPTMKPTDEPIPFPTIESTLTPDLPTLPPSAMTLTCGDEVSDAYPLYDVAFSFELTEEGQSVVFSACNSDFDTILQLFDSTQTNLIASDDDGCISGVYGQSELTVTNLLPGEYLLYLRSKFGDDVEGRYSISITCQMLTTLAPTTETPTPSPTPIPTTTVSTTSTAGPTPATTISTTAIAIECGDSVEDFWRFKDVVFQIDVSSVSPNSRVTFSTCSETTTFDTSLQLFMIDGVLIGEDDNGCNDDIGRSLLSIDNLPPDIYILVLINNQSPGNEGIWRLDVSCEMLPAPTPYPTPMPTASPTTSTTIFTTPEMTTTESPTTETPTASTASPTPETTVSTTESPTTTIPTTSYPTPEPTSTSTSSVVPTTRMPSTSTPTVTTTTFPSPDSMHFVADFYFVEKAEDCMHTDMKKDICEVATDCICDVALCVAYSTDPALDVYEDMELIIGDDAECSRGFTKLDTVIIEDTKGTQNVYLCYRMAEQMHPLSESTIVEMDLRCSKEAVTLIVTQSNGEQMEDTISLPKNKKNKGDAAVQGNVYLVTVQHARNLEDEDTDFLWLEDHNDVYVQIYGHGDEGEKVLQTPTINGATQPEWSDYLLLFDETKDGVGVYQSFTFKIYDEDVIVDDFLGETQAFLVSEIRKCDVDYSREMNIYRDDEKQSGVLFVTISKDC